MSGDPLMAIEFELTPEEWMEANAAHLEDSDVYRRATRGSQLAVAAVAAVLAFFMFMRGGFLPAGITLALGLLAVPVVQRIQTGSLRSRLRKAALEGLPEGTFGRHVVEVTDEGLVDRTSSYEWLTRWEAIGEVSQAGDSLLISTGRNAVLPIPASAFGDTRTLRRFGNLFFERVSRAARLAEPVRAGAAPSSDEDAS